MGCGCGQKRQNFEYQYTSASGQTQVFRTELEARAQVIRNGGTYVAVAK